MNAADWNAVGSCAAAIGTFVLVVLVRRQWGLQRRQAKADALQKLHEDLIGPELQVALRTVFSAKPEEFLDVNDLRLRDAAETVLNTYDLIGHRVKAQTLPRRETIATEWPVVLRIAQQLYLFIGRTTNDRQTPFKEGFQWLVKEIAKSDAVRRRLDETVINPKRHPWTNLPEVPVTPRSGYRNSRPCVAVFVIWDEKLLLLQRSRPPAKAEWDVPGGFLNEGEHPEEGVCREVYEETALELTAAMLGRMNIYMGNYVSAEANCATLNLCYKVTLTGTRPPKIVLDPCESTAHDWFPLWNRSLLPALAFPWIADAYEEL